MSFQQKISELNIDIEAFNWRERVPDLKDFNGTPIHDTYYQGWESADQYAYDVYTKKIVTGKEVYNAVCRYIYDRCRSDLDYSSEEVDMTIIYSNQLAHAKGKLMGKPLMLMPWMIFFIANLYGFYFNEGERAGDRRFSKALLMVARGNAKSTICSVLGTITQLTSPNGNPQSFVVARNEKQAGIVFNDAKGMLKRGCTHIRRRFKILSKEMTGLGMNEGYFSALPNDPESVDGQRVAIGICDELHAHHNATLSNTLINGAGATVDSQIVFISTAGINLDGPCINERNLVREINSGLVNEDSYFGIEYAIDVAQGDQWDDPETWIKANPALGHAVRRSHLEGELVRAKNNPINRRDFMTKYCNLFVNTNDSPYLDLMEVQEKCASNTLNLKDFIDKECYLGLDLAQTFDLAALSLIFPDEFGDVAIFQFHYFPIGSFERLTVTKQQMYTTWEEDGCLKMTDTIATDFDVIQGDIEWAAKMFDVQCLGYDPYAGSQLANKLDEAGITVVEVRQGFQSMSEPAKLLQKLVAEGRIKYQASDKCFEWNVANAVCVTDRNDNIKVSKSPDKPHDKVDSVVALITGLALAKVQEPVTKKNPYKTRGLLII